MVRTTYAKILLRALAIVGDQHQLARKLGVRPFQVKAWVEGLSEPPPDIFLRAVDIVLEDRLAYLPPDSGSLSTKDAGDTKETH
jgi:hypothetical protein